MNQAAAEDRTSTPSGGTKGRQTPTESLILPYDETFGDEALELYGETGQEAMEWQGYLIRDIMAVGEDGLWVHTKFGLSVPRQNGKNEVVVMREMWGLQHGEQILHTAHRTTTSHMAWERLCRLLDKMEVDYRSIRAKGQESIRIKETDGRIEFRTRSATGGLGESVDLLVIDEAQEYRDDQESALKYTVAARPNPQTIMCGTPPTIYSSGTVFTKYRAKIMTGLAENSGWAEWSVPEQSDPKDRKLWYETNPSLGILLTERIVADEVGDDAVDFNVQRLGLWLRYNQKSAISQREWEELQEKPQLTGKLSVGIKFGRDGKNVAMAIAAKTTNAKVFVECIDCRPVSEGVGWILEFCLKADIYQIVIDGANGQSILADSMKEARLRSVKLPTVREIIAANAAFEQALFSKGIAHAGQPSLMAVVSNTEKRNIGSNGGFGYRSILEGAEIALLDAVILAHWSCSNMKVQKKQRISY